MKFTTGKKKLKKATRRGKAKKLMKQLELQLLNQLRQQTLNNYEDN
jgi:hypothetical protein